MLETAQNGCAEGRVQVVYINVCSIITWQNLQFHNYSSCGLAMVTYIEKRK